MHRKCWSARQLRRFLAPTRRIYGYPALRLMARSDAFPALIPGGLRLNTPTWEAGFKPWMLPDTWGEWKELLEAADRGSKYLYITRRGSRILIEWLGYNDGNQTERLHPMAVFLNYADTAGIRVDVLGWKRYRTSGHRTAAVSAWRGQYGQ